MRSLILILILLLLILLAASVLVYLIFFSNINFNLDEINIDSITDQDNVQNSILSPDAERYFRLKNNSCDFLSGNILISTKTISSGKIYAIKTPEEQYVADYIIGQYDSNKTDKLYIYDNQTKYVLIDNGAETTVIWKNGRIYECNTGGGCTMRLMEDEVSQQYYDELHKLRTDSAYFGNTNMPNSVDTNKLYQISHIGSLNFGDYDCDNFLISANHTYASQILAEQTLSEDQRALLWAAVHFNGPMQECLDQATGIVVFRNMTLDLTHAYLFSYASDGHMYLTQQTKLVYLQQDIPEEFLRLPN